MSANALAATKKLTSFGSRGRGTARRRGGGAPTVRRPPRRPTNKRERAGTDRGPASRPLAPLFPNVFIYYICNGRRVYWLCRLHTHTHFLQVAEQPNEPNKPIECTEPSVPGGARTTVLLLPRLKFGPRRHTAHSTQTDKQYYIRIRIPQSATIARPPLVRSCRPQRTFLAFGASVHMDSDSQ